MTLTSRSGDIEELAPTEGEKLYEKLSKHYTVTLRSDISAEDLLQEVKRDYEIAHFVGHGEHEEKQPERTGWRCADKKLLSCHAIKRVSSRAVFPRIIFANACVSARSSFARATYISDLHYTFLRKGVPHYVGTLAQVSDSSSTEFAEAFYHALAQGATLGEALHDARTRFINEGSLIWAYYVHYGNPADSLTSIPLATTVRRRLMVSSDPRIAHVAHQMDRLLQRYHSAVFVGREDALARLVNFVANRRSGVLVITSKPGFGKSALLTHWIAALERKGLFVAYHFFSRHYVLRRVASAYRSLLQQLYYYYQLPNRPPDNDDLLSPTLSDLLRQRGAHGGKPLVIVLDALDEAEHPFPSPFPDVLKEGLFVVVSARDGELGENPYLEGWSQNVECLPLTGLSRDAIADWLMRSGEGLLATLSHDERFVAQVRDKTGGFPLYLHYLLEEIRRAAEVHHDISVALASTPHGFSDYVLRELSLLAHEEEIRRCPGIRTLFALLTVARGVLAEEDLVALTGLKRLDFLGLPREIRRWMTIETKGSTTFYSFSQPLLADEFKRALGEEAEEAERSLLDHCARWEDHVSLYAFLNYAEHLRLAKKNEQLFGLARDDLFLKVQSAFSNPDLALETIRLALMAAVEDDDAGRMAEFTLKHAFFLKAISRESPLAVVQHGSVQRALALAGLYEPEQRLLWYLLIAWELDERQQPEEARILLERISDTALPNLSGWKGRFAAILLSHLLHVSEKVILTLAAQLTDVNSRVDLSEWLAQRGYINASLQIARQIEGKSYRGTLLDAVVRTQVGAKDFAAALKTAGQIDEEWHRDHALGLIAAEQARSRGLEAALQTTEQIHQKWRRAETLALIAQELSKGGMAQEASATFLNAVNTAHEIEHKWSQVVTLGTIAELQAAADGPGAGTILAEALSLAGQLEDPGKQAKALATIAKAQARAGDKTASAQAFAAAIQVIRKCTNEYDYMSTLQLIAQYQAESGEFDSALSTANYLSGREKAETLAEIAEVQAKTAGKDAWKKTFDAAIKEAVSNLESEERAYCLIGLAVAAINLADTNAGRTTLATALLSLNEDARFTVAETRAETLICIAALQSRMGQNREAGRTLGAAAEAASGILDPIGQDPLLRIAFAQAYARDWVGALKTANSLADEAEKANTMELIAERQAKVRDFAAALQTTYQIHELRFRDSALEVIAKEQAGARNFDAALHTADRISQKWQRARALAVIAEELSRAGVAEKASTTFRSAIDAAQRIGGAIGRVGATCQIAEIQGRAGFQQAARATLANALRTARGIANARDQAQALKAVSLAHATTHEWTLALELALGIYDPAQRAAALVSISQTQLDAGATDLGRATLAHAVQAARSIPGVMERSTALHNIAEKQKTLADWDDAFKTAVEIPSASVMQELAISSIALAQAKAGEWAPALEKARAVGSDLRERVFQVLAEAHAAEGHFPAAFDAMAEVGTVRLLVNTLTAIAAAQQQRGDSPGAHTTFSTAIQTVQSLVTEAERSEALYSMATVLAKKGLGHEAIQTAQGILVNREKFLPDIAESLVATGNSEYWKRLLVPCSYHLDASYRMCTMLARAYPAQIAEVAAAVIGFRSPDLSLADPRFCGIQTPPICGPEEGRLTSHYPHLSQ